MIERGENVMVDVITLKRQHEEINAVITGLRGTVGTVDLKGDAFEVSQKINLLAGILKIHLGNEDRYMYPHLLQSGNDDLKKIAQDYVAEMGSISNEFLEYKNHFNTRTKINSNTREFVNETQRILKILEERIKKEDVNLYPIL
jgi:DUF438 domain-containing protein